MARSEAATVEEYLAELPAKRREAIAAARKMVLANLPKGYVERMNWGMITYEIPLEKYPDTYNKQPLAYVALAAQKNYNALYLMGVYGDSSHEKRLREAYRKAGRKLDMGKSCLRFSAAEDLLMDTIGDLIAEVTPADYIRFHEKSRAKA